jgi:hypothetical protein
MHKQGFGQAYCIDLLKRIRTKFILYWYEFSTKLYEFYNFELISRNI